ncbi:uncharacterized protein LOC18424793 isoform X3 [Amborella trichopoda]|uniref:uncharacterized protein LOC18424793 isoform X3 n=1 Tax=Amborella trichopoda TaxID=13333 RepID=UPI0009BDC052|nr:uncharacterized protein LOC18424793 isoform X3 [Amborella trichopoda]|eukprot:XP_020517420.1 uncharacterized protein LOC18424793 isoform X3 [Amborella trichopoda]
MQSLVAITPLRLTLTASSTTLSYSLHCSFRFFPFRSNCSISGFIPLSLFLQPPKEQRHHHHQISSRSISSRSMATASANTIIAPYGSWKSPITADVVAGAEKRLGGMALDGNGSVIWLEGRPKEAGRMVLVKGPIEPTDVPSDITLPEFSVRTLAQEYGGGAFTVYENVVIFSHYNDQRLYMQSIDGGGSPVPISPEYGGHVVCYADGVVDKHFNRFITVREDHRESSLNPSTTIVSIDLESGSLKEPKVLVSGNDFYAFPRICPEGKRIAWVEWSHPNMHWDKAEIWVADISKNGDVCNRICVAGCDSTLVESPTEPKWSMQGELFFITDRKNGFWNLYKWIEHNNEIQPLYTLDAEFSRPFWVFGINSYDFIHQNGQATLIACSYRQKGKSYLGILDTVLGSFTSIDVPFTDINDIITKDRCLYIVAASSSHPSSIVKLTLDGMELKVVDLTTIWCSSSLDSLHFKPYISLPEIIEFPTEVQGQKAYAYFYPPFNPLYDATPGEKPPLLLKSHGGPTSESHGTLDLSIQYWTSRGWAFVDVNYGGSTGYGREYRERLLGNWGIVDVNDCCSCAQFLVDSGKADGEQLCITGRSAGGYTTLAALAFSQTFKAGASLFGVADLRLLKESTHKFESRYLDNLLGAEKNFYDRSPINFVERFSCPVILFQGLEDKEKGLPVALVEYEGEQHGFRKVGRWQVHPQAIPWHIQTRFVEIVATNVRCTHLDANKIETGSTFIANHVIYEMGGSICISDTPKTAIYWG